jgi:predicted XRE-type DNA-binding protein
MSIEKKSLISNRSAAKKALVTKPEVNKVASTKLSPAKLGKVRLAISHAATRVMASRVR